MHDLTLNEEIQLTRPESMQILMNKVIESVFCHIAFQVLFQQGSCLSALARGDRCNQRIQFCPTLRQKPFGNTCIVFFGVFLFLILRNIVYKADHNLRRVWIILKCLNPRVDFLILPEEHKGAFVVLALLVVVLLSGRIY